MMKVSDITFYLIIAGTTLIAVVLIAMVWLHSKITNHENEYQSTTINRTTNLRHSQEEVLNIYERSNIKIPVEIIEDLQYNDITEHDDIIDFIENQRHYWKLENTKKPYLKK